MQILVMGDPQMTFGGIWSKTWFFVNFVIFDGLFDPHNVHILVMGDPKYDIWGHLGQNGSLLPTTL